jgi:hypothetical protein
VCEDLIPCEHMRPGAMRGAIFTHVVTIATTTFGAQIPPQRQAAPEARPQWRLQRTSNWRACAQTQRRPLPTTTIEETARWR